MKVLQFPMVRITVWLVIGILFSYFSNLKPYFAFGLLLVSLSIFTIVYFIAKKHLSYNFIFGISTYLVSFFIGACTQTIHNGLYQKDNYIHQVQTSEQEHQIKIVVREKLKANDYTQKYIAEVQAIDNKESSGRILLNFYKKDSLQNISVGNIIYLNGKIVLHQKPKNPDQFDYGNYLNHKSIFAQMYVSSGDYIVSDKIEKNIFYYANKIRNKMLTNLKNSGFQIQELNVVAALVLGQKQDLSTEILQDYQFAGAIHILFVCLLDFLIEFFAKIKKVQLDKIDGYFNLFVEFCYPCRIITFSSSICDYVFNYRNWSSLELKSKYLQYPVCIDVFYFAF